MNKLEGTDFILGMYFCDNIKNDITIFKTLKHS